MFKKIEIWIVLLIIIFLIFCSILFGSLLSHHYKNGKRFPFLQNIAVFIAEIPKNAKNLKFINGKIYNAEDLPLVREHSSKELQELRNKSIFKRYTNSNRNELLVLPRYDGNQKRSIVDIIDLNNFKVLHRYSHDVNKMNDLIKNKIEHPTIKFDDSQIRFEYRHPIILEDGSLISDSDYSPLFKINVCSELEWMNDSERFHHSKMLSNDKNIWVPSQIYPYSKKLQKHLTEFGFQDDAITKINLDGKILFQKSVVEILLDNNIFQLSDALNIFTARGDPIHLNDIEEAKFDTDFWKKGDLFLSSRHQNAIIHYRPSTNKVINFIKGPFYNQHDVDIISENEIGIFNNNEQIDKIKGKYSNILIYNFETKKFSKKFDNQLKNVNFKTVTQGLMEFFDDGSLLVEEHNKGRLILFNNKGEIEWEFINKDDKNNIYIITWSRIIKDKKLIENIKNIISNKKC